MRIAVYPGSFDPVTLGHIDIIQRASTMVDRLIIGVLNNSSKTPLFSAEERVKMIQEVCADLPNVEVQYFNGLLVDFVAASGATIVVRGLRAVTDFEYELQWAQSNRAIYPQMDTLFLVTNVAFSYLSSSVVREYASHNGDVSAFVTENVAARLTERFGPPQKPGTLQDTEKITVSRS